MTPSEEFIAACRKAATDYTRHTLDAPGESGRSFADEMATIAFEVVWSALHDGAYKPVFCPCGRRWPAGVVQTR